MPNIDVAGQIYVWNKERTAEEKNNVVKIKMLSEIVVWGDVESAN